MKAAIEEKKSSKIFPTMQIAAITEMTIYVYIHTYICMYMAIDGYIHIYVHSCIFMDVIICV